MYENSIILDDLKKLSDKECRSYVNECFRILGLPPYNDHRLFDVRGSDVKLNSNSKRI